MIREEELQQRHHLEAGGVEQQPLHVGGLARLQQPARAVDEDSGGEDGQQLERLLRHTRTGRVRGEAEARGRRLRREARGEGRGGLRIQ